MESERAVVKSGEEGQGSNPDAIYVDGQGADTAVVEQQSSAKGEQSSAKGEQSSAKGEQSGTKTEQASAKRGKKKLP